jgi:glycosyltransferase involved in cell wall biosynthesis
MKIAQVPRRFVRHAWGGTETVVLETSKRLLQQGHQTEILCPNALAESDSECIGGVDVRRFSYFYPYLGLSPEAQDQMDRKGGNMFSLPLMRALKSSPDLDLIHLHTGKRIGGIGRYVAKQRGIPYIVSLHGGLLDVPSEEAATWTAPTEGSWEWGKALGWWVGSRRLMDDAAAIVCVGQAEKEATQRRYPNQNVVFLPNGANTARFAVGDGGAFRAQYNIPQDAFVAGSIGRIDPQKNQKFLLDALPEMLRLVPNLHLLLVGHVTNEAYRAEFEREAAQRGLQNRITLIPGVDAGGNSLVDAYHALDLFLLPSQHEPFGIAILEAWAAGKPVIASRVGGIPSFVEDGVNGLLYAPGDTAAFLRAFQAVQSTPGLSERLARTGCQTARKEYDWNTITNQLIRLYESVVQAATVPMDKRRPVLTEL